MCQNRSVNILDWVYFLDFSLNCLVPLMTKIRYDYIFLTKCTAFSDLNLTSRWVLCLWYNDKKIEICVCVFISTFLYIPVVFEKIDTFLLTQLSLPFSFQATEQMNKQVKKSSSIIVALTDGKLEPYIHKLTKEEVSWYLKSYIFFLI